MIHVARMTEFVDEYVVDEFMGQLHQRNVEADSPSAAAASPSAAAVAESYAFIVESVGGCERGEPAR